MTTFDPNDERITAYILGDDSLSADDCFAVAEMLSKNPEAQRFADELRMAASLAGKELAMESVPAIAPTANIETAVRKELDRRPAQRAFTRRAQWLVAAGLVIGAGFYIAPKFQTNREVAQRLSTGRADSASGTPLMAKSKSAPGYGSVFGNEAWTATEGKESAPAGGGRAEAGQRWDFRQGAKADDGTTKLNFAPEPSPANPGDVKLSDSGVQQQGLAPKLHPNNGRGRPFGGGSEPPPSRRSLGTKPQAPAERGAQGRDLQDLADGERSGNARDYSLATNNPVPVKKAAGGEKPGASAEGLEVEKLAQLGKMDRYVVDAPAQGQNTVRATIAPADPAKPNVNGPVSNLFAEMDVAAKTDGLIKKEDARNKIIERELRHETLRNPNFGVNRVDGFNRESYPLLKENDFLQVNQQNALSTFSIDVDTASYALVRKFLTQNTLPPPGAVRLEEMVNYFRYNYEGPKGETPFAAHLEIAECPWNPEHRLARIALKGREIDQKKRPPSNLVFLVDISGSMNEPNKLPLVRESLKLLVDQLGENDHVAIAVYASGSGLVLDSTNGSKKAEIVYAIDNLRPSGSTNGAAGIQCAYDAAVKGFIKGGTNRVILCTDGDFNVGVTSDDELVKLITEKAKSGVFLSTLAVGEGNLQDKKMMELSNKGNGNYGYLDSIKEAKKLLVEQMTGTLLTIAKDVKIQVEFNPTKVGAYRLIGYEKRMLKNEDFKDDKKDAGEIGAGHTITALYELVPAGKTSPAGKTDPLVFQKPAEPAKVSDELAKAVCLVKLRYKQPEGDKSTEVSFPGNDEGKKYTQASEDFRWAAAAASFAMILRDSPHKGNATPASVLELAQAAKGSDPGGYRAEFLKLVETAKTIKK